MKKLAIVGSGVAGLGAAWLLRDRYEISIFEAGSYVGGHTNTFDVPLLGGGTQPVDTGFIVFNEQTYPHLLTLFRDLGVEYANSDMSFAHYNTLTGLQWSSRGLAGLFAQRKNLLSPRYYKFLLEANRFNTQLPKDLERGRVDGSFGDYLRRNKFSDFFMQNYIVPMTAAVWSTPPDRMLSFPARTFARFFVNHGFLSLYSGLQWKYVVGGSRSYVKKILAAHKGKVHLNEPVSRVSEAGGRVEVLTAKGRHEFDAVLLATHADQSLRMLANPSDEQKRLLSKFKYEQNRAVLHSDENVLQPIKKTWASWNFKLGKNSAGGFKSTVVYYMNLLQNIPGPVKYFVSLNDFQIIDPAKIYATIDYEHPLFDEQTEIAQAHLPRLNETGNIFFSGSYFRYGFHEDAYMSAVNAAEAIARRL
ncbi:NAD(P)/FAD-dependent oxidoreductase [Turneriella parva]|uniref:Amine oxidase n=1 Tax=Turneriella parva (strain ATCC BAA-1111 / DSM 21527 / NCTC 11395 / H) TaxID=869212 RepID=I4B757_TURPD|nr:FAD-dependent oxidoreductase [Turneriella parva]AFM13114.1 amine oxidase [Turneriella parva DSM 21527]